MTFDDNLKKDIKNLERQSVGASKSMYKRIKFDYDCIKDLISDHSNEKCNIFPKDYNYSNVVLLADYIALYLDELKELSQYMIDYYKQIGFYYYGMESYQMLYCKDEDKILKSFLEYFNKDLVTILDDLLNQNRAIYHQEKNIMGITYSSSMLDSYYLGLAPNISTISMVETVVHELNHIYAFKFAKNYNYNLLESLYLGLLGEVTTLYSELSLSDYLIKNNIMREEVIKHRNTLDYIALGYYKTMRYVTEALTEVGVTTNGVDYQINGDFDFNPDQDKAFFKYGPNIKSGSLGDFTYGVSYVKAYEMLEKERLGLATPKENIDDFIISLQDEANILSFLEEPLSFPFYENELLTRKQELIKKYPIPGYKID